MNITGSPGDDILNGDAGDDTLFGDAGNDTLIGQGGNDRLDGGLGFDFMLGGTGDDIYVFDSDFDFGFELADEGIDTIESSVLGIQLFDNFENLVLSGALALFGSGNSLDNTITGNGADNLLRGWDGNDILLGGDGHDILEGGAGNDYMDGGASGDSMQGGAGDDIYVRDDFDGFIFELAGEGIDTVLSSAIFTELFDNVENLVLSGALAIFGSGNSLDNTITGNGADNLLRGRGGSDTLVGGAGNDHLQGDSEGESGNDILMGGDGQDILEGGAGNDYLDGGALGDGMKGDAGDDIYVFDDFDDFAIEHAGEGIDTILSSVSMQISDDIENLVLTGQVAFFARGNSSDNSITGNDADNVFFGDNGNDTLSGGAGNDRLEGENGDDRLEGGSGQDLLLGGFGTDTLIGGAGNDFLDGGAEADVLLGGSGDDIYIIDGFHGSTGDDIIEYADEGIDTINSFVDFTANLVLAANVENLILLGFIQAAINVQGNSVDNLIIGNGGNNWLLGDAGNDTLEGGGGHDRLDGGAGADFMVGGQGDDTFVIDSAFDVVIESNGGGIDTIETYLGGTLGADFENLVLIGQAAIDGQGNSLANIIIGNSADNRLFGGVGNDTLIGGDGNDQLAGGSGADILDGGLGIDTADYSTAPTDAKTGRGVRINLVNGKADYSDAQDDQLSGIENLIGSAFGDNLTGNAAANRLDGGSGDDTVAGGAGADVIDGGSGNDTLSGAGADTSDGAGDTFVFDTALNAATNVDIILQFEADALDKFALDPTVFAAITGGATAGLDLSEFRSRNGVNAADVDDYILYDSRTGNLFYDADGSGAGAKVLFAQLVGVVGVLDHTDFTSTLPAEA